MRGGRCLCVHEWQGPSSRSEDVKEGAAVWLLDVKVRLLDIKMGVTVLLEGRCVCMRGMARARQQS